MNFDQALEYLLRLGHETLAMKFGLENTESLLDALGNPHKAFPKVQLAGTNGKGSTAVMLDSICRSAGIRTGLYTSPHLQEITERISIAGKNITRESFALLATDVAGAAQRLVAAGTLAALPTFFEHVTVIALAAFHEQKVDLAILETGLGGRLDSTTAARAEVVAITPIALDHQEYLGTTLAEIAAEKAAIIRPGVTAIIAPQPRSAMDVILNRCAECCVEPALVGNDIQILDQDKLGRLRLTFRSSDDEYRNVRLGLPGRHQVVNASLAVGIAEALITLGFDIPNDAIVAGLERAIHPGRLEWRMGQRRFLFDGAHNVAGTSALREFLDEFVDVPITLVFGAMRNKNLPEMAETLFPIASRIFLTEMNNPRSATREDLLTAASNATFDGQANVYNNSKAAFEAAIEETEPDGLICITGSLYLVGELRALLQNEEYATCTN